MKILFVATVDLHIQTFHLRTIHQLHARGDIVDVCTNGTYTNEDIHHKYTLPFSRNPLSLSNLKAKKELRKILIKKGFDSMNKLVKILLIVISATILLTGLTYAGRKMYEKAKACHTLP